LGGINFITAHDGFCLKDLVSYDVKHNQANGESNRDGTNGNHSFNHGHEGSGESPEIRAVRRKAARNLMATMLFSAGIPMVAAGDERGKSQNGNNNAYCQDNVMSWVNWDLSRQQEDFETTFSYLTNLRHTYPSLRPKAFGDFNHATDDHDMVKWYNADGEIMSEENWHDQECRTIQRLTKHTADKVTEALVLVIHGSETAKSVTLPEHDDVVGYELIWNSAHELPPTEFEKFAPLDAVTLSGTSIQLFRAIF
jgi:glycogen operon protein